MYLFAPPTTNLWYAFFQFHRLTSLSLPLSFPVSKYYPTLPFSPCLHIAPCSHVSTPHPVPMSPHPTLPCSHVSTPHPVPMSPHPTLFPCLHTPPCSHVSTPHPVPMSPHPTLFPCLHTPPCSHVFTPHPAPSAVDEKWSMVYRYLICRNDSERERGKCVSSCPTFHPSHLHCLDHP